jgi:hypothetical protein
VKRADAARYDLSSLPASDPIIAASAAMKAEIVSEPTVLEFDFEADPASPVMEAMLKLQRGEVVTLEGSDALRRAGALCAYQMESADCYCRFSLCASVGKAEVWGNAPTGNGTTDAAHLREMAGCSLLVLVPSKPVTGRAPSRSVVLNSPRFSQCYSWRRSLSWPLPFPDNSLQGI